MAGSTHNPLSHQHLCEMGLFYIGVDGATGSLTIIYLPPGVQEGFLKQRSSRGNIGGEMLSRALS